ncbi:glycosyltransferase [Psychrobacillus sp. FSL H8-0487]|uniref:glycosyltransferase n=1 Tax=Psychrobacillus sp. FSL H8-0487 TaxID=2921391 RepID=UPI0030FAE08D
MKKNFLFLGFAISDQEMKEVLKKDKFPPIQTHKFIWNLIKGMEIQDNFNFTYISARPISDYPFSPQKIVGSKKWNVDIVGKRINILEISFINTSIFKVVTRFFSGLYYSIKNFHKEKNKGAVIVYSVHVPFMMIGYIISKIYKIDFIGIWTDPPSIKNERESIIKSKLRKIELFVSRFLMKKTSKVITLTKYLAEDFAPKKPYLVIEGIIDEADISSGEKINSVENTDVLKIVYTGSLEKRYGIKNIVEGFKLIKENKIILEIYGHGDYEEELKEICIANKNIRYKGFVPNEEILKIQKKSDFLINARSADDEYVKYSFPSKTLEYMLSGTPLITTMLPGMPKEYKDYVYMLENNEPITIFNMIQSLRIKSDKERNNFGIKAQKFALSRNYKIQGKKIIDFIN